jgi:hypothetical protein
MQELLELEEKIGSVSKGLSTHKFEKLDRFDYEDDLGIQEEYPFSHSAARSAATSSSLSSPVCGCPASISSTTSASACGAPSRKYAPTARQKYSDLTPHSPFLP